MAGYQTIMNLRSLEKRVDRLGLRMDHPRYGGYQREFGDLVALSPKDDTMPVYSRDAELFVGTLEQMEHWLNGWEKMRQYHRMLIGNKFESKIQRLEQDYRNEFLMKNIKQAGEKSVEITDA
jgi:hypothetical protein